MVRSFGLVRWVLFGSMALHLRTTDRSKHKTRMMGTLSKDAEGSDGNDNI